MKVLQEIQIFVDFKKTGEDDILTFTNYFNYFIIILVGGLLSPPIIFVNRFAVQYSVFIYITNVEPITLITL